MRRELDLREADLAGRERAVTAAQTLVEDRLQELSAAETRLEALIATSDGAAQGDLDRLTRMYETMPAENAAALFEEMDLQFAAGFLARMSAPASASVMAELSPQTAYALSVVIATRNTGAPTLSAPGETPDADTEN